MPRIHYVSPVSLCEDLSPYPDASTVAFLNHKILGLNHWHVTFYTVASVPLDMCAFFLLVTPLKRHRAMACASSHDGPLACGSNKDKNV